MNVHSEKAPVVTMRWVGEVDGYLELIDQTKLPSELVQMPCHDVETVWEAIRALRVRGAPAIGIAAAYGVCLGLQTFTGSSHADFLHRLEEVSSYLESSRPTAVNLFWAMNRLRTRARQEDQRESSEELLACLLEEARRIEAEDLEACQRIGAHGAELIEPETGVLTHCNAGGLATAGYGTALAVIYAAHEQGKAIHVYADETRPLLQGARLTAWELHQHGVPVTLICDSMAAQVMREGRVRCVVTGADRIAANGDTANKIGTYSLALLAEAHGIPFYVAAPTSTFDLSLSSGEQIPIEQRANEEVTHMQLFPTAPEGIGVYNPAFDVTPARLIRGIVCEHGVISPVNTDQIAKFVSR